MACLQKRRALSLLPPLFFIVLTFWFFLIPYPPARHELDSALAGAIPSQHMVVQAIDTLTHYFIDYPVPRSEFGEMGRRVQILLSWIQARDGLSGSLGKGQRHALESRIDALALSMFPFLKTASNTTSTGVLSQLRDSFSPGSRGIVIAAGTHNFRYACHLVGSLRDTIRSSLPIQIAYSGDDDLPEPYRDFITSLGSDIDTLDITTAVDDSSLRLAEGGWAIKPFAALASRFEQVVLMDADTVFLQDPAVLLDKYQGYLHTGALLFHDRLIWQGAFQERHAWWKQQMRHHQPSDMLLKSLVFTQNYAEEQDSGVVVLDKARTPVFLGLLHVCWQNTLLVRTEWTYKMHYGDKDSWWLGLELSNVPYTFEEHYGAVLGSVEEDQNGRKVCGFTIAHADEEDKLLWYNGSLLKNKVTNATEFTVPDHWMVDGRWEKGAEKQDTSCMRNAAVRVVEDQDLSTVQRTVERAGQIDRLIEERGLLVI